ncbi:MAG: hypothetical protein SF172_16715 [Burkholderiales bacterium]|nr:hypothetical protein [Burkholderiales bacterium]
MFRSARLASAALCLAVLPSFASQPAVPAASATPTATASAADATQLAGRWTVDLRSAPGEAAYTQPFVVESVDVAKRSIAGSFYNSTISWSRINTAWGKVVVTFVTSDGQGDYVHTATLENGKLVGTSTARHRNMLVPWTAVREK